MPLQKRSIVKGLITTLVEIAIVAYCCFIGWDLFEGWTEDPYSGIAFALSVAPIIGIRLWLLFRGTAALNHPLLLVFALILSTLGYWFGKETVVFFGIAVVFAGLFPWFWKGILWIFFAFSWLPWFTMIISFFHIEAIGGARLFFGVIGGLWALYWGIKYLRWGH